MTPLSTDIKITNEFSFYQLLEWSKKVSGKSSGNSRCPTKIYHNIESESESESESETDSLPIKSNKIGGIFPVRVTIVRFGDPCKAGQGIFL